MSPLERTLAWLRAAGWVADKSEQWVSFGRRGGIRRDLFGFIDVVAVSIDGTLGVQVTDGAHLAEHREKIDACPNVPPWVAAGNRVILVGWRQVVARNKDGSKSKRKRWSPRVYERTVDDWHDVEGMP